MKGLIKGVLSEELSNSLRMKKKYAQELAKLPKWCLARKKIKGHYYFYLVQRDKGKLLYDYKGKLSSDEVKKYKSLQFKRASYRKSLSKLNKQVKFLRGTLRGKQPV
jgi:chaperonin cofactor prefoldin